MKAIASVFVIGALFASGQQPAPVPDSPRPAATFSVTSTLVQVDAVVTDSKGHHVTDLTPEDFQVFEDGKLQKLTHFAYVRVAPGRKTSPELRAAREKPSPKSVEGLPPPPSAHVRPEDVRRTIVLMVDDLGLSFESMAFVRWSLRKFVNHQMQPGDLVAVCRTGAGSGVLQHFSVDRRVLLSVIGGLRWNPVSSDVAGSAISTLATLLTVDYIGRCAPRTARPQIGGAVLRWIWQGRRRGRRRNPARLSPLGRPGQPFGHRDLHHAGHRPQDAATGGAGRARPGPQ